MKTFQDIRLREMAKPVTTPSRLFIDSKYNRNTVRSKQGLPEGQNLFVFYEYIKANKTLPFRVRVKTPKKRGTGFKITDEVHDLRVINHAQVLKQIELAGKTADPVVGPGDMKRAKDILDKISFKVKGGTLSLYDIDQKSLKFKNSGLTGGGENRYNQSLQCIISACAEQGIYPSPTNAKQIEKWIDISDVEVSEALKSKSADWLKSAVATHRALVKKFGRFKNHIFHEERSDTSAAIYSHMKKVFKNDGIPVPSTTDRWNPADIWIVSTKFKLSDITSTTSVKELNDKMLELFDARILMGVSMKKADGRVGGIKMMNHPDDQEGFNYYTFKAEHGTALRTDKPVGSQDVVWWESEDDPSVKMMLTTYGAKNDPNPRVSSIRFGLRTGSGGNFDGTVMSDPVLREICKPFFTLKPYSEVMTDFIKGYSTDSNAFWSRFAKMWKESNLNGSITKNALREYCYERYPYDEDAPLPFGKAGHAPGCTYLNCHFLAPFMGLSPKKKVKLLDALYRECASLNLSSVHVTVGRSSDKPLITSKKKVKGPSDGYVAPKKVEPRKAAPKKVEPRKTAPKEKMQSFKEKEIDVMARKDPRWRKWFSANKDTVSSWDKSKKASINRQLDSLTFDELMKANNLN